MKAWEQTEQQKRTNRIKQLIHKTNKQNKTKSLNFNIKQIIPKPNIRPHIKDHRKGKIEETG